MSAFVNGLNFRRFNYGNSEATKINVEQVIELKRQRLLEKEGESSNDMLIKNLCEMKFSYEKTKYNSMKSGCINTLCGCWYTYNEFVKTEIQENLESDDINEISLFNKNTMIRFRTFLNENQENTNYFDPVNWEMFIENDSVNRFIFELSEQECTDLMDENSLVKISQEKSALLKQYFDYLKTYSNETLIKIFSDLCVKSVSSFSISSHDLALLYGIHHTSQPRSLSSPIHSNLSVKRPIVFVVKYISAIDFILIPLLFKEAGIDPPVYFVGESKQVLNMRSILNRLGYVIVRNSSEMKIPKLQSFIVEKKAAMILEAKKSICLVLNNSVNSYCSASEDQTEIRILHSAVNTFIDGKLDEPIIVPLTLNHEFIPKQFLLKSDSAWSYNSMLLLSMLTAKFGMVKLTIWKPIYYSQFASDSETNNTSTLVDTESRIKKLVKHLAVFSDKCKLIMPTHLVAFLLLYHFKDKKLIPVNEVARMCFDLNKFFLTSESLGFEYSSFITTIRRGCNMLSHCISVSSYSGSNECYLTVNWEDFSVISELNFYADVIVHKLLMKAVVATAFVTESRFSATMGYIDQLSVTCDSMNNSITNLVKIILSRYFQFLLPCETLDNEISKLNTWWNETMISATKESDSLYIDGEFQSDSFTWRTDVFDSRIRDQMLILYRCLTPRLESINFIIMELMLIKQNGLDVMTLCSELYYRFVESIKKAAKSNQLRYRSCMNSDYFVSGIITLAANKMLRIFDMTVRECVLKPENVDLLSSRFAILDSEYYNLQRWKTFIDLSLTVA